MALSSVQKLILGFVVIIVGVVLITQVASSGNAVTQKTNVFDESQTIPAACLVAVGSQYQVDEGGAGTASNESFGGVAQGLWINQTGYTLAGASTHNFVSGSIVVVHAYNQSSGLTIPTTNYTVSAAGVLRNTTSVAPFNNWNNVTITYTYTRSSPCFVTVTNYPTDWKVEDCPLTNVVVSNSTGTTLTLTTDYTVSDTTGVVTLKNTTATRIGNTATTNSTLVDYTYCGDNYVNVSWGRSVINLVPGFFGLALLIFGVGLTLSVLRENDIV